MRACVVGSTNVDLVLQVTSLPLPGETALATASRREAGGKGANQACALARLGADVALVSAVGGDGAWSLAQLRDAGVTTQLVATVDQATTGLAVVLVEESGENSIVVVPGANLLVTAPPSFAGYDVVVLSLEIPLDVAMQVAATARQEQVMVVLNAAPAQALPAALLRNVDVLVLNEGELAVLGGDAHGLLFRGTGAVVVTAGAAGCLLVEAAGSTAVPAPDVRPVDTTGAGDCFTAALSYGLAAGWSLARAAELACDAAALSVTRLGARAGLPTLAEVLSSRR